MGFMVVHHETLVRSVFTLVDTETGQTVRQLPIDSRLPALTEEAALTLVSNLRTQFDSLRAEAAQLTTLPPAPQRLPDLSPTPIALPPEALPKPGASPIEALDGQRRELTV